jgi:hypothetical protein
MSQLLLEEMILFKETNMRVTHQQIKIKKINLQIIKLKNPKLNKIININ